MDDLTSLLQHLTEDELKDLLKDDGPKIEDMIKEDRQVRTSPYDWLSLRLTVLCADQSAGK